MKKYFFILLAIFAMSIFTGCEKEEEEEVPMQLTEFIVGGNWVYSELDYSNPTHVSTIVFTGNFWADGTYDLLVSSDGQSMGLEGTYTIEDVENEITISNPFYEEGENDEFQTFAVEWQEGIDEMYWSDTENGSDDVMKWVRNYEE